jgi:hypothetical protein
VLANWKPRHLIGISLGYWAVLGVAKLRDAAGALWRISNLPDGQASVAASYADGLVTATASEAGRAIWTGAVTQGDLLLWVAGPPLLLVIVWFWTRGRELRRRTASTRKGEEAPREVGAGPYDSLTSLERVAQRDTDDRNADGVRRF